MKDGIGSPDRPASEEAVRRVELLLARWDQEGTEGSFKDSARVIVAAVMEAERLSSDAITIIWPRDEKDRREKISKIAREILAEMDYRRELRAAHDVGPACPTVSVEE